VARRSTSDFRHKLDKLINEYASKISPSELAGALVLALFHFVAFTRDEEEEEEEEADGSD